MKRLISLTLAVFCCICLIVASERRAYGYVDPGSGLLALQGIASVVGTSVYFMRRKIMALFHRKPTTTTQKTIVMPVSSRTPNSRTAA